MEILSKMKDRWHSLNFPCLGRGYCKIGILSSFQIFLCKLFFEDYFSFPFQPGTALCPSLSPLFIPIFKHSFSCSTSGNKPVHDLPSFCPNWSFTASPWYLPENIWMPPVAQLGKSTALNLSVQGCPTVSNLSENMTSSPSPQAVISKSRVRVHVSTTVQKCHCHSPTNKGFQHKQGSSLYI